VFAKEATAMASATPEEVAIDRISIPLGGLGRAAIKLNFGGGEMAVGRAQAGTLLEGTFEGGVDSVSKEPGAVELSPSHPGKAVTCGHPLRWELGISAEVPVDLCLETGANKSVIDLSALHIHRLDISTGASDTTVRLPASGETSVHVHCGMASVVMEIQPGVAAWIRGHLFMGGTAVDETRFPRADAGGWVSPDYDRAANRVDISVEGAFGSVRVV
jgi:hypothetical protein